MPNPTAPTHLHYLIDHQVWARPEGDGTATVGITALGVQLSGEIYMCRPKAVGVVVEQGQGVAVVELAKSIVSVKSPVSGEVVAVNERLANDPELVHQDPYGVGWLARIRLTQWDADAANLVTGDAVAEAMARHARLFRVDE